MKLHEQERREAVLLLERGAWLQAREALTALLLAHPHDIYAHSELVGCIYRSCTARERLRECNRVYAEVLRVPGGSALRFFVRAEQLVREEEYEQAVLEYRQAITHGLPGGLVHSTLASALTRLPTVRGSGLTPLGEAMHIAATRLIVRPENRKIMVVLTDGKAGCETGDAAAAMHAEHVAGRITRTGTELVGVGIQDDSLRTIVADTIVIHKLEDLPAQLCKLLGRTLQKGLSHVR